MWTFVRSLGCLEEGRRQFVELGPKIGEMAVKLAPEFSKGLKQNTLITLCLPRVGSGRVFGGCPEVPGMAHGEPSARRLAR